MKGVGYDGAVIVEARVDQMVVVRPRVQDEGRCGRGVPAGAVTVNGTEAKPGRDLKPGDTIAVRLAGGLTRTLGVVALPQSRVAAKELPDARLRPHPT